MGQRKTRLNSFGDKTNKIVEYIKLYQHSLRAIARALSDKLRDPSKSSIATIGKSEIWPCTDGAVVLIYESESQDIEIDVKDPIGKNVTGFLRTGSACAFYTKNSIKANQRFSISIDDASKVIIHFGDNTIKSKQGVLKTKYKRGSIIGWEAELENPDKAAFEDFQFAYTTRNVGGEESTTLPIQEKVNLTRTKADELINLFNKLLETSAEEEDIQDFIKKHPEFLYPDYIECYPKFKLGEDYITDYVLLVQSPQGLEYVFVEIERPDKDIFVKAGQFSSEFTQAKDQLLDWDNWLTKNHAYISRKLPGFYKPQFHLIIGRDTNMAVEQKEKIQSEFIGTARRFSTYDDLVIRFKKIVDRLLGGTVQQVVGHECRPQDTFTE